MVESNMKTNLEKVNSIVSGQGQPLKYLVGFEQESRSHLGNLEAFGSDLANKIRVATVGFHVLEVQE